MEAKATLRSRTLQLWAIAVYIFLFAPILVVALTSFNPEGRATIPKALTGKWYRGLLDDGDLLRALRNSLIIALITASVSATLGLMAAWGLSRYRIPGRGVAQGVFYLPMLVPAVVSGVAMLTWYHKIGIPSGWATIIIAHIVYTLPFTVTIILTSFAGFDSRLEEAAMDLGATPWRTFRLVTLPLVLPGVLGGAMMAFTLSFDEFVLTFFVAGGGVTTLPLEIYNRIRYMISPEINAISTIVMAFSIGLILVAQSVGWFRRRRERALAAAN